MLCMLGEVSSTYARLGLVMTYYFKLGQDRQGFAWLSQVRTC